MSSNWREQTYRSYLSKHYAALNRLDATGYELAVKTYARIWDPVLPANRATRCLDLGCGVGQFLYYLRARGFENLEGVDRSPENVQLAQQMGFAVCCEDGLAYLRRAEASGTRYGLLSVMDVIEHLSKQELFDLLALAARVLEDSGRVFVKTLNAASFLGPYGRYMDITHELAFSEESLRQVLLTAGFRNVRILQPAVNDISQHMRRWLKRALGWFLYRIVEGRPVPACLDLDLVAVAER